MFAYYARLGLRSLRRNPALTLLMVIAMGFGVSASITSYAVFRATSNNPIPQKSAQLYVPQIDNWGPARAAENGGAPPDALSYADATALMLAHKASRQTAMFPIAPSLVPSDPNRLPFRPLSYAAYADTFAMFDVPFEYGGGWTAADDQAHAAVAVIGRDTNQRLFGGANSVGRTINLDGRDYRITGVMDTWNPQPLFFDPVNTSGFSDAVQLFVPFTRAIDQQMSTAGDTACNQDTGSGWQDFLRSECVWIAFWAELPSASEADAYRQFLQGYAAEQQRAGRFHWTPNVRLSNVTQWLADRHVVPPESRMSMLVSVGFLLICLVNTIGLLLAKSLRRSGEVGLRRALGASRGDIYKQFLVEAGAIGAAGGLLGLLLTGLGMFGVGLVFDPSIARLVRLDAALIALTLLVAILATLLAAFYPTWRAAQVQPAWQLKSN